MKAVLDPPLQGEVAARRADGGVPPAVMAYSLANGDAPPSRFARHLPLQGRIAE